MPDVSKRRGEFISTSSDASPKRNRAGSNQLARGCPCVTFMRDRAGSALMTFATVAPLLLVGATAALDYVSWASTRQKLAAIADSAALTAAKELTIANRDPAIIHDIALRAATAQLASFTRNVPTVAVTVAADLSRIEVAISRPAEQMLGNFLPSMGTIVVKASARATGRANICVLGLDETSVNTISFSKSAKLTADRCSIYSNSVSAGGFAASDSVVARAQIFCSSGGYKTTGSPDVAPRPIVDCPKMTDPLAGRAEPGVGPCDHVDRVIAGGSVTITPGTYCGGLVIRAGAIVTASPGIYVMKDGPLRVTDTATLRGVNVGIFLCSSPSPKAPVVLRFEKDSTIDLTAPKDGALAGLLVFESRSNPHANHRITSDNARVMLGTIYLPVGTLNVDSAKPVSDLSAYTVIVARRLLLDAGPNLYLNTNYGASDIPVPKGLGPVGGKVTLSN